MMNRNKKWIGILEDDQAVPYDDIAWIPEVWYPAVKGALRTATKKAAGVDY